MADRVQEKGRAIVLNEKIISKRFHVDYFADLLELLTSKSSGRNNLLGDSAEVIYEELVAIEDITWGMLEVHEILKPADVSPACAHTLRVIGQHLDEIRRVIMRNTGRRVSPRALYAMHSDTADAFTNGKDAIYLLRELLEGGGRGPTAGISWAFDVTGLLVHEYLTDIDSRERHKHDERFYEVFHEVMHDPDTARFSSNLFMDWTGSTSHLSDKLLDKRQRQQLLQHEDIHETQTFPALEDETAILNLPVSGSDLIRYCQDNKQDPPSPVEVRNWLAKHAPALRSEKRKFPDASPNEWLRAAMKTDFPNRAYHHRARALAGKLQSAIGYQIYKFFSEENKTYRPTYEVKLQGAQLQDWLPKLLIDEAETKLTVPLCLEFGPKNLEDSVDTITAETSRIEITVRYGAVSVRPLDYHQLNPPRPYTPPRRRGFGGL